MFHTPTRAVMAALCLAVFAFPAAAASVKEPQVTIPDGMISVPDYVDAKNLAANTAEDQTVPTFTLRDGTTKKAGRVVFAAGCNFFVNYSTTATVPGDVTNGSASEQNPTSRSLAGAVTTISVISEEACRVTMSFYR